jgi:hypothetical protein
VPDGIETAPACVGKGMMMKRTMILLLLSAALPVAMPAAAQAPPPGKTDEPSKLERAGEAIATRPARDLNLMKDPIPPRLLRIMDAPYDIRGIDSCPALRNEVARMTAVIGPDVDSAEVRRKKGKKSASEFILDGVSSISFIPFSGLVRKISGAEAEQRRAQAAVLAGHIRRAYIKGILRARGC